MPDLNLSDAERKENAMTNTCELCGRLEGEFDDPTFDVSRVIPAARATARPLRICELCAKTNIETEMMRLGQTVN